MTQVDNGTMQKAAKAYANISDNSYHFVAQKRSGEKLDIMFNFHRDEFTHVIGLDHLPTIKAFTGNKARQKRILFKKIIAGTFDENNLNTDDNSCLSSPVSKYFNPTTQKKYTIEDRIKRAVDIDNAICIDDDAFIYKNWNSRQSKIKADYVLSVNSKDNSGERLYFFAFISKNQKNKDTIEVNVYSSFADSNSLVIGQSKPYAVISEDVIPIKSPEKAMNVYKTNKYSIQKSAHPNIIKFQMPQSPHPLVSPSGIIVATEAKEVSIRIPSPPPIKEFFAKLGKTAQNAIHKLKQIFSSERPEVQPENPTSQISVKTSPSQTSSSIQNTEKAKNQEEKLVLVAANSTQGQPQKSPMPTTSRSTLHKIARKVSQEPPKEPSKDKKHSHDIE